MICKSVSFHRLPLPTAELRDTHLEAFGDSAVGLASLEDPLVLFNPPTLGFVDEVIAATTFLSARLKEITLPLLVSTVISALNFSCTVVLNVPEFLLITYCDLNKN